MKTTMSVNEFIDMLHIVPDGVEPPRIGRKKACSILGNHPEFAERCGQSWVIWRAGAEEWWSKKC